MWQRIVEPKDMSRAHKARVQDMARSANVKGIELAKRKVPVQAI